MKLQAWHRECEMKLNQSKNRSNYLKKILFLRYEEIFKQCNWGMNRIPKNYFTFYDAWETLNMTQLEYLDQLQQLLLMQVELERILEIK